MSIDKRQRISALVSGVAARLGDDAHRRWSADEMTGYVNEALGQLAARGLFTRTDLHPSVENDPVVATLAEPVAILRVAYEGRELAPARLGEMVSLHGPRWRKAVGRPRRYLVLADGVRLYPRPSADGPALVLPTVADIPETAGAKIDGDGTTAAINPMGVVVHFRGDAPGAPDGEGTGVVRIDYAYHPRPSTVTDTVPSVLAGALEHFVAYRCLSTSEAVEEMGRAEGELARWREAFSRLIGRTPEEARDRALAFAPMVAL